MSELYESYREVNGRGGFACPAFRARHGDNAWPPIPNVPIFDCFAR